MRFARSCFAAGLLAATAVSNVPAAHAGEYLLTLSGNFYTAPNIPCFVPGFASYCATTAPSISSVANGAVTSTSNIPNGTPFTETALFDTSSPNLAASAGIPGTAFYSPLSATLSVSGSTYQIAPYSTTAPFGAAVAIFDKTSPFPSVPEYGVALIGNVLKQGSGILADFTSASPDFTVGDLTSTTFSGYVGTGVFSGSCESNCAVPAPPNEVDNVEPVPLTLNGKSYELTLPDGVLVNYSLALNDPNSGAAAGTTIDTPFTASIIAVPEPNSILMLGVGLFVLPMLRSMRRG